MAIALAIYGAAIAIIVYTPFANVVAAPLLEDLPSAGPMDVAIVLSGGRYDDGSLNEAALERTVAAVTMYRRGLAARLWFSGGPCCGRSASRAMAELAMELGVPESAITLEERSERTRDSAVNCARMLRAARLERVAVVTSHLHARRAARAFAAVGVTAHIVKPTTRIDVLAAGAAERITLLTSSVHEYLGLAYYQWRGWSSDGPAPIRV